MDNPSSSSSSSTKDSANIDIQFSSEPVKDERDSLLEKLVAATQAALIENWDASHKDRALFTDINEMKTCPKENGFFVKPNYIREKVLHLTHPVINVLFVGVVEQMDISDGKLWLEIRDKTGSILAMGEEPKNDKEIAVICEEYSKVHKNFRDIEMKCKATDTPPTQEDEFALNVSRARWLLARRRKGILMENVRHREPDDFVGKMLMIIGKLSEYQEQQRRQQRQQQRQQQQQQQQQQQRYVQIRKYVFITEEQSEWVQKNLEVGRWYEDYFKKKRNSPYK